MMLNLKGILQASTHSIIIGSALVLLFTLLLIVGHVLGISQEGSIVRMITGAVFVIYIPVFFLLYLWTGWRAKRRFHLHTREAGIAAAFSYGIAASISFLLNTLLLILAVGDVLMYQITPSMFDFGGIFSEIVILGSSICGIGVMVIGLILNAVIGMCGSIISENM